MIEVPDPVTSEQPINEQAAVNKVNELWVRFFGNRAAAIPNAIVVTHLPLVLAVLTGLAEGSPDLTIEEKRDWMQIFLLALPKISEMNQLVMGDITFKYYKATQRALATSKDKQSDRINRIKATANGYCQIQGIYMALVDKFGRKDARAKLHQIFPHMEEDKMLSRLFF